MIVQKREERKTGRSVVRHDPHALDPTSIYTHTHTEIAFTRLTYTDMEEGREKSTFFAGGHGDHVLIDRMTPFFLPPFLDVINMCCPLDGGTGLVDNKKGDTFHPSSGRQWRRRWRRRHKGELERERVRGKEEEPQRNRSLPSLFSAVQFPILPARASYYHFDHFSLLSSLLARRWVASFSGKDNGKSRRLITRLSRKKKK